MILIWGVPGDSPAATVSTALARLGQPVFFFDQHDILAAEIDLKVDGVVGGTLRLPRGAVDLTAITAAYLRPYESALLPALAGAPSTDKARMAALTEALVAWSEVTPALVVNRPGAMASNNSKPYQSGLIADQGFDVPETLVTTDAAALEGFWEKHGHVVYKSISGVRSIVTCLTPGHRQRFADLCHCPTQFQQYIPGTDFRVHVVGDEVFACKVISRATDYRYPRTEDEAPRIEPFDLSVELTERCRRLAASMSLLVAGIDLRKAVDGRWFCFEVNPSPGFSYYEQETEQPIADAIARLLTKPA